MRCPAPDLSPQPFASFQGRNKSLEDVLGVVPRWLGSGWGCSFGIRVDALWREVRDGSSSLLVII